MNDEAFLNRAWLNALRAVAARSLPEACARFGIDVDAAVLLAGLSLEQVERIADTPALLFRPVIPGSQLIRLAGIDEPASRGIYVRLHTTNTESPPANGHPAGYSSISHNNGSTKHGIKPKSKR